MNRTAGVCLSALGLVALIFLCPTCRRSPIEQHLKEQSEAALTRAGLTDWTVGFEGRDARLFGPSAEAEQARTLVAQVPGVWDVQLVNDSVAPPPAPLSGSTPSPEAAATPEPTATATPEVKETPEPSASPQALPAGEPTGLVQVLSYGGVVYVRGVYPDEASRQSAVQAAKTVFGTGAVRDETALSGSGGTLGWPAETLKSLSALKSVRDLELSAGGDALILSGIVASAGEKQKLAGIAKASLPENITLENRLTLAGEKLPVPTPSASTALPTADRQKAQQLLDGIVGGGQVLFATASSRIQPEAYPYLNQIGEALKSQTTATIVVGGHTDNQGEEPDNRRLSQKRADSVRAYLVARGMPVQHLYAQGYGSSQPITTNTTEEGRRRNRRIGFIVR